MSKVYKVDRSKVETLANNLKNRIAEEERKNIVRVADKLSSVATELMHTTNNDMKIQIIANLNVFIKKNFEIIEKYCSDKLVSILNSL